MTTAVAILSAAQHFSIQDRAALFNLLSHFEFTGRQRKRAEQLKRGAPESLDLRTRLYMCCKDRRSLASIFFCNDIENRLVASRNLDDSPVIHCTNLGALSTDS